ncbi:hypothetical protein MMC12_002110 [Toensbergia leucococca]|nr:hypothetical protein [Toensbergia leucococca]
MRRLSASSDLEVNLLESVHASNPEELQDLVMSSDGEPSGMTPLPPHLAARFSKPFKPTKPSKMRRKSSAASSRHNSISSLHSSRSNRSAHGGPQSSHIAQHLRRASIIESRRARLADKAAHAEKVRLRAAMVKAAPRVSSNTEERAVAAELAREKYLAQVAANCAEQVKRARKVAEDMKEKKAAEHLKLKEDMEEKLAEAEKRRVAYQQNLKRARLASLPVVEERKAITSIWKPKSNEEAARLIQKAWRNRQRRRTVAGFLELGLTIEHIQNLSFEEVGALLSQEKVLATTANMLKLCGLQDGEGGGIGERTAVRSFLSAFLILGQPETILSHNGEQEQDLIIKAQDLLLCFENVVSISSSHPNFSPLPARLTSLSEAYSSFQTAFAAWKDHDSSVLVQTMLAQFVELDAIWQSVKGDTNDQVAADYQEGIQSNQALLLARLKRLAGKEDTMKMVREAVRASRKSKLKTILPGDKRPRGTSNVENGLSTPVPTTSTADDILTAESLSPAWDSQARELGKVATVLPDNRMLVHELAINKEYRIDVKSQTELRDSINQAVFGSMRRDIAAGFGDHWIVAMAQNIRETLLRWVEPGKPFHILISEVLDPVVVETEIHNGNFSYEKFFSFMNSILPKFCAPVRDEELKAFSVDQSSDPIDRLAKLMHILDLMSLDSANFMLEMHAPELIKSAAEYEQKIFSERIASHRLTKTIRWWSRAREKTMNESARRIIEGTPHPANRTAPDKIYMQGLVDLIVAGTRLEENELPETLELDLERVIRIRSGVLRMITISAILLTAKNLLKRDVRSQWKAEAQRMWDLSYDDFSAFLSIIESGHAMPLTTKTHLSGIIDRVLNDARNGQVSHPIMKVLLLKVKTHVFTRLSASSAEERLRATTSASEVLASGGLSEYVGQIGSMVDELRRVADVDREAHGKWYDEISEMIVRGSDR